MGLPVYCSSEMSGLSAQCHGPTRCNRTIVVEEPPPGPRGGRVPMATMRTGSDNNKRRQVSPKEHEEREELPIIQRQLLLLHGK